MMNEKLFICVLYVFNSIALSLSAYAEGLGSDVENLKSRRIDAGFFSSSNDGFYNSPWSFWGLLIFILVIFTLFVYLSFKASSSKKEHQLAMENLSYFKSVLNSNMFVLKFELFPDEKKTITYYYSNDNDISGNGISKKLVDENQYYSYRLRIHPEDLCYFDEMMTYENLLLVAVSGKTYGHEMRVMDSDGEHKYYSVSLHGIPSDGKINRILLFARNINEEKKQEEEKRRSLLLALETAKKFSDSKTRFLSQMSHDIRTPLNAIVGMTNIALMNQDNREKVEECLNIVLSSSNHLLSLINDILDMSKIETGKLSFNNASVSITDSFNKSVTMHIEKMNKAGISYSIDRNVIHDMVFTDATRLEQVFSNIISNAVKYTKKGGHISINISENASAHDERRFYEFKVTDTGIGMSEETVSKIFEPFERAKEVAFVEGSGLGMAITKNIVDVMGGVIDIDSKLDAGTTVTVTFGFNGSDVLNNPDTDEESNKKEILKTCIGLHALVVEDVEINAMFAEAIAQMKGFEVDICENGKAAVEKLINSADGYYSLVLMDIQMPVMNGYEATRAIRCSDREYLRNIPIIAMSANAFAEDVTKSKNCGMNDHIAKPVDINKFSEVVDLFVKEKISE